MSVETAESALKTEAGQCLRESESCCPAQGVNNSVTHIKPERRIRVKKNHSDDQATLLDSDTVRLPSENDGVHVL